MTEISTEFANDGYFVRSFIPAQTSDVIVVSFTGVRANERYDGTFFGQQVAKALNIPFIGIVARSESWYLENGINEAIAEVRRLIAPIRAACQHHVRIVGYGVSMGGYAAIKYARALEFDAVIFLAPIYSIDFEETGRLNFCSGFYQPYMKGMAPKNDEVTAPCYILYDPHNAEDKIEAEVIRDNIHNVRCVAVPYATHMVGFSIKGSRNFAAMLETVLANGDSTPVIRKIRSRSAENILYMLVACHGKKPTLLVKALNSRRACETGARERFLTSYREPGRAAARLIDLGHCEKAFTLLKMLHNPDIAVPIFSKLLTWTGEFLAYDPVEKLFHQTDRHRVRRGELIVVMNGTLYSMSATGLTRVPFTLHAIAERFAILSSDGKFLSTLEDGRTAYVEVPVHWEIFTPLN